MSSLPTKNDEPTSRGDVVATAEATIRRDFIRKVYSILTLQFLLTVAMSCAAAFIIPVREFLVDHRWLALIGVVVAFACIFALFCFKQRYPINLALLVLFTLGYGFAIAVVVGAYFDAGAGVIVLEAAALTAAVFFGLTAIAFITKKDFSFLGGFLFAALLVLVGASLINFVFGAVGARSKWFTFAVSVLGALVMSGYILYDTSLIIHTLGPDQAIQAAISLYLDVSNLFLYLLNILSIVNQ